MAQDEYEVTPESAETFPEPTPIDLPSLKAARRPLSIDMIILPEDPIQIEGKTYYMRSTEHLGSSQQQKVFLYWSKISEIEARIKDDVEGSSEADDSEIDANYVLLFGIIMPKLPTPVVKKMPPPLKKRLFSHFLDYQAEIYNMTHPELTEAMTGTSDSRSTGDGTSPA